MSDLFYCHIHVPKTGGTSFTKVLKRNFSEQYEPFEGLWPSVLPRLTPEQVGDFIERFPGIKAVSSHQLSVFLPFDTASRKVVAVAFVRDPVERFFSFYFHMRHKYGVKHIAKEMELAGYVDHMLDTKYYLPGNMLAFLTGNWRDIPEEYELVCSLVKKKKLYLLPTSNMQKSLSLLSRDFCSDFNDIEEVTENVSKKDAEVTSIFREKVNSIVSPYCYRLLDLANDFLDKNF